MSNAGNGDAGNCDASTREKRKPGARRRPARTPRGEQILAVLDERGLTLQAAAGLAGVSFETISRVIHEHDPGVLSVRVVTQVCEGLGLPLGMVAPGLAKLTT